MISDNFKEKIKNILKFLLEDTIIIILFIIFWSLLFIRPDIVSSKNDLKKLNNHIIELKILVEKDIKIRRGVDKCTLEK